MPASGATEQEDKLKTIFVNLEMLFKKLEKAKDGEKLKAILKEITDNLKEAKTLVKDFEREARIDGLPPKELAERKRSLVTQLNNYIAMKKSYAVTLEDREELFGADEKGKGKGPLKVDRGIEGMTTQELMTKGRQEIQAIDTSLKRTEKLVEDTIQIGTTTAATLSDQTKQMNKIVDDLNQMEFTMKRATQVIRDIGKGLLTDQCIRVLLFFVVAAIIAVIVLKIVRPGKKPLIPLPNPFVSPPPAADDTAPPPPLTRRLLMQHVAYHAVQLLQDAGDS